MGIHNPKAGVYLQSSIPFPPFPHSLLNNRIPVTSMARFFSCCSLSFLLNEMKALRAVWGNILCRAARTIAKGEKAENKMIKQAKITSPEQQLQKVKIMANLDFKAEQ